LVDIHNLRKNRRRNIRYIIKNDSIFIQYFHRNTDYWIKRNITFEDFIEKKQRKIKNLDTIAQFLNKDLMSYLKKNKNKFWKI